MGSRITVGRVVSGTIVAIATFILLYMVPTTIVSKLRVPFQLPGELTLYAVIIAFMSWLVYILRGLPWSYLASSARDFAITTYIYATFRGGIIDFKVAEAIVQVDVTPLLYLLLAPYVASGAINLAQWVATIKRELS